MFLNTVYLMCFCGVLSIGLWVSSDLCVCVESAADVITLLSSTADGRGSVMNSLIHWLMIPFDLQPWDLWSASALWRSLPPSLFLILSSSNPHSVSPYPLLYSFGSAPKSCSTQSTLHHWWGAQLWWLVAHLFLVWMPRSHLKLLQYQFFPLCFAVK